MAFYHSISRALFEDASKNQTCAPNNSRVNYTRSLDKSSRDLFLVDECKILVVESNMMIQITKQICCPTVMLLNTESESEIFANKINQIKRE